MDHLTKQFRNWPLVDLELIRTPSSDIKDSTELFRRYELIQKFIETLNHHAPEILTTLKNAKDMQKLLRELISSIKTYSSFSFLQKGGNSIQYFSLKEVEPIEDVDEVNYILSVLFETMLVKIPSIKLTTLINSSFFPSSTDVLPDYINHDAVEKYLELEKEPVAFWSYFTFIPIDNVIPKVNYYYKSDIMPENYPKLENIEESNYLQYMAPINVKNQEFANKLVAFNQKYELLNPNYYVSDTIDHRRYEGGLTLYQLQERIVSGIRSHYPIYTKYDRWAWDLLTRLDFRKTKGNLPLTVDLIDDLLNIIYSIDGYREYYCQNLILKIALSILSGNKISSRKSILYHLSKFLTIEQLRELYFDPRHQRVFRLDDDEYLYLSPSHGLSLDNIEKAANIIIKYPQSVQQLIYKDIIDKIITTIPRAKIKTLLNKIPSFFVNCPPDMFSVHELNELLQSNPRIIKYLGPTQLDSLKLVKLSRRLDMDIINRSPIYKPDLHRFGLTIDSPQSSDFQSIMRSSAHNIYKQTPESIDKARQILDKTSGKTLNGRELEETIIDYFSRVPTLYNRRKSSGNSKLIRWQSDLQSRQLSELSSRVSSNNDYGMRFELETDSSKVTEITDFFYSGIDGSQEYRIDKIYRVYNSELETRWKNRANPSDNIFNLWHGTSKRNLMAIVENGLKLPDGGGMFGPGIYFAPLSIKSMGYSDNIRIGCRNNQHIEGWLLYNQVDMGRVFYPTKAGYTMPGDYDSVYAKANTVGLARDEMVIYNTDRVLTTHLVKIKCQIKED